MLDWFKKFKMAANYRCVYNSDSHPSRPSEPIKSQSKVLLQTWWKTSCYMYLSPGRNWIWHNIIKTTTWIVISIETFSLHLSICRNWTKQFSYPIQHIVWKIYSPWQTNHYKTQPTSSTTIAHQQKQNSSRNKHRLLSKLRRLMAFLRCVRMRRYKKKRHQDQERIESMKPQLNWDQGTFAF